MTNSLYYTENSYKWEVMNSPQQDYETDSLADELLGYFYYDLYYEQIKGWDWQAIKDSAKNNPCESFDGDTYGSEYLGNIPDIYPSGKYWLFFASSNVDREEQIKDTSFSEALETVASEFDMWLESSEGDACDLYVCCSLE